MRWTTPDFVEINLSGEVTAYANTDGEVRSRECELGGSLALPVSRREPMVATRERSPEASA